MKKDCSCLYGVGGFEKKGFCGQRGGGGGGGGGGFYRLWQN